MHHRGRVGYITRADNGGHRYFSLGNWENIERMYGLDDLQMFDLFNKPSLDEAIQRGQTNHFTHDPDTFGGALKQELHYLTRMDNGYRYDPDAMIAFPKKETRHRKVHRYRRSGQSC